MKLNREQYLSHMLFQGSDREWFCEIFGPLPQLKKEWQAQGATQEQLNLTAFDWDNMDAMVLAGGTWPLTGLQSKIIEDTAEQTLAIDYLGRHTKLIKSSASIALPTDFPINCPEDWERVRPWFAFQESRVGKEALPAQRKEWESGKLSIVIVPGAFDMLRELMGEVTTCVFYYEEPDLIKDMLNTMAAMAEEVITRIGEVVPIDCVYIHEDMAGKSGPLIGPNIVREFSGPYYKRVITAAKAYGAQLFSMDSDGDLSPILDELIASGINSVHPCEPVGGMDVVKLRQKYGTKISFKGGIDKHALRKTKEDIRKELEYRMDPSLFGGGMVFGLDHEIPNGVSLENYVYYVNLGREILGLPPIGDRRGWQGMAF